MPIRVKTPKGVVEFPDGTSEADMTEALKQMDAPATGPGPVSRFVSSAATQLNPISAIQGLYEMTAHPFDTAAMIGLNSVMQGREAIDAAKQGRYADAASAAVGAVPLVGPAVQTGIEEARAGNYAGAAGTAAGLAVPFTRPLKLTKMAGLSTLRAIAPEVAEAVAGGLDKLAAAKVVDVVAPKVGANKVRLGGNAAKVAPELLKRGLTDVWSREGLHDNVKLGLEAATRQLDAAAAARPAGMAFPTSEIVTQLEAARDAVMAQPVTGIGKAVAAGPTAARVAALNRAIKEVNQLGDQVSYDALRQLREGWDQQAKPIYSPAMTPDYVRNRSAQLGAADVTGTIREYLASKDTATAAANAEYSFFRRADDVLKATEEVERTRPAVGRKIMNRVAGSIAGGQLYGLKGAIAGYAIAPALEVSTGMGLTTKLKTATIWKNLADAIRSGNTGGVDFYARQLRRTLLQTGVLIENEREAAKAK